MHERNRATLELVVALSLLELVFWTDSKALLAGGWRTLLAVSAGVAIFYFLWNQRPSLADFGLQPRSGVFSAKPLIVATAIGAGFILSFGFFFGTISIPRDCARWFGRACYQSLGQQILLHVFLMPRLSLILQDVHSASRCAGLIFGLLHVPNPILTPLTIIAGWYWVSWFRQFANLPAVWMSHLILGTATFMSFPEDWLRRMRVGIGYFIFP
jgi:hypothetical protein